MLLEKLKSRLKKQDALALRRKRNVIVQKDHSANAIYLDGQQTINFANFDYLGLTKHPKIVEAFTDAVQKYGFGSGASAQICGYSDAHYQTEIDFAKWLNVDRAILFNSGYHANTGIISALVDRSDTLFSDKLCHASLLDGIQLSRAKHYRYQHCSVDSLMQLAEKKSPDLIVSETVFSMEGDIAPVKELVEIAEKYQAGLLLDDAHGIGIFGDTGAGICQQLSITQDQYTCLVVPLGKAFNATGAIVAGREQVIESILQFSRSYRYTTALSPAICQALQAVLKIVIEEQWRREQLQANIRLFIDYALEKKLQLISTDNTPIKSILVYDNQKVIALQKILLAKGFFVAAIRPPTIPENSARLKVSLNCLHTQAQIMQLIDLIHHEMNA